MHVLSQSLTAAARDEFVGFAPPAGLRRFTCRTVPVLRELHGLRPGLGLYHALAEHFARQSLKVRTVGPVGVVVDGFEGQQGLIRRLFAVEFGVELAKILPEVLVGHAKAAHGLRGQYRAQQQGEKGCETFHRLHASYSAKDAPRHGPSGLNSPVFPQSSPPMPRARAALRR